MHNARGRLAAVLAVALLAVSLGVPAVGGHPGAGPQQQTPKDCEKHPDQQGCKGTPH